VPSGEVVTFVETVDEPRVRCRSTTSRVINQ
jgi:hypothetical protein